MSKYVTIPGFSSENHGQLMNLVCIRHSLLVISNAPSWDESSLLEAEMLVLWVWCQETVCLSVCLSEVPQRGEMTQTHWRMKWGDLSSVKPFWCCTFPFQSWRITTWGARNIKGWKKEKHEEDARIMEVRFHESIKEIIRSKMTIYTSP